MKNIKICFLGIVTIAMTSFVYSGVTANKQILQREKDYILYIEAKNSIELGENIENSIKVLDELSKNYNESYVLDIDKAVGYSNLKDYKKGLELFEQALNKNNGLYKNPSFFIMYAEAYKLNGNIEKASECISIAQQIGIPKEYQEVVEKLISEIG